MNTIYDELDARLAALTVSESNAQSAKSSIQPYHYHSLTRIPLCKRRDANSGAETDDALAVYVICSLGEHGVYDSLTWRLPLDPLGGVSIQRFQGFGRSLAAAQVLKLLRLSPQQRQADVPYSVHQVRSESRRQWLILRLCSPKSSAHSQAQGGTPFGT